jgi:hypothetical protein
MTTTQKAVAAKSQRMITELRRERDATPAGKAALTEVLDFINRSPGDPGPVFGGAV